MQLGHMLQNIKKLVSYSKSKGKLGFPRLRLFHTCLTMATWNMEKVRDIEERLYTANNSAETDGYSTNGLDASLSEEAIDALNLILEGTVDQSRSLSPFSELVRMPGVQADTGFSKSTHTYQLRSLHSWIRSWLTSNPFSVENCIHNGRRLQWRLPYQATATANSTTNDTAIPGAGMHGQLQPDLAKRQKIATNAHQVPRTGGRSGSVTLDKCRKLTIVLGPIENSLLLSNCEDCLIVSACRRVVLVSCRRCTLHLAVQSRPILIQPPPLPTVVGSTAAAAAAATAGIGQALGSVNGLPNTTTSASVGGGGSSVANQLGNEEILLAPFHATYVRLCDHLARANLSTKVNYWDQPFLLGQDNRTDAGSQILPGRGRCWELLHPTHFYPFNIPLLLPTKSENPDSGSSSHLHGNANGERSAINNSLDLSASLITDTQRFFIDSDDQATDDYVEMAQKRLPIPLPTAYLCALKDRASVYQKWPQHISHARLTPEQRQLFGTLVDQRFRQWLSESGNLRQLQLLELSTSHCSIVSMNNPASSNATSGGSGGVPPAGANSMLTRTASPIDRIANNGMGRSSGSTGRLNGAVGLTGRSTGYVPGNPMMNGGGC